MYMNTEEIEKERFSLGDIIVQFSNIEITHANDNKPPLKEVLKKVIIWTLILAIAVSLFLF